MIGWHRHDRKPARRCTFVRRFSRATRRSSLRFSASAAATLLRSRTCAPWQAAHRHSDRYSNGEAGRRTKGIISPTATTVCCAPQLQSGYVPTMSCKWDSITCFLMSSPLLIGVSSRRRTMAGSSKWLPDKSGSFTSTTGSAFFTFFPFAACQRAQPFITFWRSASSSEHGAITCCGSNQHSAMDSRRHHEQFCPCVHYTIELGERTGFSGGDDSDATSAAGPFAAAGAAEAAIDACCIASASARCRACSST